jgi:drug/metabolite transporter (DMT)-like permease
MTIVAPIAACGAAVPLVLALAGGDRPVAAALAGALVALAGAVLASLEERAADERGRRDAVVLAAVAALLLGVFSFFLGRASQHGGVLSALFGARVGSLTVLCIWALSARVPLAAGRRTATVAAVGLVDLSANALYALAASRGVLAVVAVLGSLYPIPTVVLARAVLGERVSPLQRAGVAIALVGVAVVAGAS